MLSKLVQRKATVTSMQDWKGVHFNADCCVSKACIIPVEINICSSFAFILVKWLILCLFLCRLIPEANRRHHTFPKGSYQPGSPGNWTSICYNNVRFTEVLCCLSGDLFIYNSFLYIFNKIYCNIFNLLHLFFIHYQILPFQLLPCYECVRMYAHIQEENLLCTFLLGVYMVSRMKTLRWICHQGAHHSLRIIF